MAAELLDVTKPRIRGHLRLYFCTALAELLLGYGTGVIGGAVLYIRDDSHLDAGAG